MCAIICVVDIISIHGYGTVTKEKYHRQQLSFNNFLTFISRNAVEKSFVN